MRGKIPACQTVEFNQLDRALIATVALGWICISPATIQAAAIPAAPAWEVSVSVPCWYYELWVDPPDGAPYLDYASDQHSLVAKRYMFLKLQHVGQLSIIRVPCIRWAHWQTYLAYEEALMAAEALEQRGFETRIKELDDAR